MATLANPQLDDELLVDVSVPLSGVNNSLPPNAIQRNEVEDGENRLTQSDGLNRPRPGLIRLKKTSPTGGLDSIHHLGNGVFLVNDGALWYTYDNRSGTLTSRAGGPNYLTGDQVYSTLADTELYFAKGTTLDKYDPATNTFGTVTLLSQYPTALYPIWANYRLMYAYQNTIVISDILDPEYFDPTGQSVVTLDPVITDEITGQILWKDQRIAAFRNGSTWLIETGPGLPVLNWSVNRVSATIGCRCHGTVVQAGNDVYFLSETGRGIYALGQAPTSDEQGIWIPLSASIQDYINRINWAACDNARATYWNDLYLLSIPLDGASFNNFILVYSVSLKSWQGLWCFDINGVDTGARDGARDRSDPNGTVMMIGTHDGTIARFSYPVDRQYYDKNIDLTLDYFTSTIRGRAFTFGEDINQIRPHSMRFQFLESEDPVQFTALADRTIELYKRTLDTSSYLLSLTIPGFPFDLDREGFAQRVVALLKTGICTELQFLLEGTGNWTLFSVKAAAFETHPLIPE